MEKLASRFGMRPEELFQTSIVEYIRNSRTLENRSIDPGFIDHMRESLDRLRCYPVRENNAIREAKEKVMTKEKEAKA